VTPVSYHGIQTQYQVENPFFEPSSSGNNLQSLEAGNQNAYNAFTNDTGKGEWIVGFSHKGKRYCGFAFDFKCLPEMDKLVARCARMRRNNAD
jgi:hypothetical protein